MPNNLLVSTPNVEGNISSCKTEITYLNGSSRPSLFYVMDTGYATNNCTGQVDNFSSWELSGFSIFLISIFGTIAVLTAMKVMFD